MRNAEIKRDTAETKITLWLDVDGTGKSSVDTGVGFLDHMLTLFAKHSGFDLVVECHGDTYIDDHHSVEDIGICLGMALRESLGDKRGIRRYGDIILPMDEALILAATDLSGRFYLGYEVDIPTEKVGTFDTELVEEFLLGFARNAEINLHIQQLAGKNSHHIIEGIFKAMARALREATSIDERFKDDIPSTKGTLAWNSPSVADAASADEYYEGGEAYDAGDRYGIGGAGDRYGAAGSDNAYGVVDTDDAYGANSSDNAYGLGGASNRYGAADSDNAYGVGDADDADDNTAYEYEEFIGLDEYTNDNDADNDTDESNSEGKYSGEYYGSADTEHETEGYVQGPDGNTGYAEQMGFKEEYLAARHSDAGNVPSHIAARHSDASSVPSHIAAEYGHDVEYFDDDFDGQDILEYEEENEYDDAYHETFDGAGYLDEETVPMGLDFDYSKGLARGLADRDTIDMDGPDADLERELIRKGLL